MRLLRHVILFILMSISVGCQNNGDIGILFGQWTVDKVVVDGVMVSQYPYGKVFLRFQGNIVAVTYMKDVNVNDGAYVGVWSRTPDTLTLDFSRLTTGGSAAGNLPPQLLIPGNAKTTFDILKENSKELVITYIAALTPSYTTGDREITLYLRKIY